VRDEPESQENKTENRDDDAQKGLTPPDAEGAGDRAPSLDVAGPPKPTPKEKQHNADERQISREELDRVFHGASPTCPFRRLTGGASAASEEAKPTNESAARAC
jgi:hypothetical protein